MSILPDNPTTLSTAWMPLDGLAQHWGQFGSEATNVTALSVTSNVFAALAKETAARSWHALATEEPDNLRHALAALVLARQQWSEALFSVTVLLRYEGGADAPLHALALDVLEQQVRLSTLISEVEREQLAAARARVRCLEEQAHV
ncbi:MAG: hypothetical protein JO202_17225 [Ktedonobacteraceae bacterium]|nr:hypothetical protein [Ktedonobacteraceae bacterium]